MTKRKDSIERDEADFHVPLHEQEEFKSWAKDVVLKAIRKAPSGTRMIRARLGPKLGDERRYTLAMALEYLVLHKEIHRGGSVLMPTYTTKIPKEKSVSIPKKGWEKIQWNQGVGPRGQVTPHYQQMTQKRTA